MSETYTATWTYAEPHGPQTETLTADDLARLLWSLSATDRTESPILADGASLTITRNQTGA